MCWRCSGDILRVEMRYVSLKRLAQEPVASTGSQPAAGKQILNQAIKLDTWLGIGQKNMVFDLMQRNPCSHCALRAGSVEWLLSCGLGVGFLELGQIGGPRITNGQGVLLEIGHQDGTHSAL